MIPKIIHYVWFGGDKPAHVENCIASWRKFCPDYEIREWNETNTDLNSCDFVKEAMTLKQYSFVSDVIRLAVLLEYGGIYLDTDVKLLKTLDPFLQHKSFVGKELPLRLSTAVIGAEPNMVWIKEFLNSYTMRGKHFIDLQGKVNQTVNTILLSDFINNTWHRFSSDILIYPEDYFCCKSYFTKQVLLTDNSVAIHDFDNSWGKNSVDGNLVLRIRNFLLRIRLRIGK